MKKNLLFCLILVCALFSAQYSDPKITLKQDWKTSSTFKGKISGQPITMYLEFLRHSGWHDKVFAVKGWYYYDRFKEKIPLAGYYDGDLMLYNFKNPQDYEKIAETDLFCWTEPCPKFENFNEFLEIKQDTLKVQKGSMTRNNKVHPVQIYSDILDITLRDEWLTLPNGNQYNLRKVLDGFGGNKIVSTFEDKKENRILLFYERDSNFNKQGFCGAGPTETGYRLLTFDKKWRIRKFQVYSTNSCLANIDFKEEYKTKYDFIKAFYIVYENKLNLLVVNLKNSTFGSTVMRSDYDPFRSRWTN